MDADKIKLTPELLAIHNQLAKKVALPLPPITAAEMPVAANLNAIPAMTDPLGRYWDQPADIRQALMDETHVLLSAKQLAELKEYSTSYPTGTYDGKCWKRELKDGWCLCWYHPHPKPNTIGIGNRTILEI